MIRAEGRSIAREWAHVNLSLQAEIGSHLVDVHGQSEHLSLLKVKSHRELLDRFARNASLLDEYHEDYRQWQANETELRRLEQLQANVDERVDILRYQIGQIEAAKLSVDEEESLRQERTRLANAEVLSRHARSALQALDESDPESFSVTDLLGNISNELISLARIDPQTQTMADQVEGALTTLSDLAYELRRYSEQIEFNPARLDQIELRIDLINNLKRKHGGSVAEVLNFYHKAQDELEQIENVETQIQEIKKKIDSLKLTLLKEP